MKPFDLEKALAGEPVVTRNGARVTKICVFEDVKDSYPVITSINGRIRSFTSKGAYVNDDSTSPYDLFMAPKKRTVWVNLYPDTTVAMVRPTKEQADSCAMRQRIGGKAWPLEIEE